MSQIPSVKCCECEKSYPMKTTQEFSFQYCLPDGFVTVTPNVMAHGQFRDYQGSEAVINAVKEKVQPLYFCPDCSTGSAHLPVPQATNSIHAPAPRRIQSEPEPVMVPAEQAPPEVEDERPVRREKRSATMFRGSL